MTSYFGENAGWLEAVKAKYDPTGFWSTNPLSIPGAGSSDNGAAASPDAAPSPGASPETAPAPTPAPSSTAGGAAAGLGGALLAAAVALLGVAVLY